MIASGEIQSIDEMVDDTATMQQQSISITPEMRARVGLGVPLMQKQPKDIAKMFKDQGFNADEARAYMETRGVAPQVVDAIISNMRRQKTGEQKAAERMAEQKPATRTGPPLPMSEQVEVEARGRKVVGEGRIVIDEKAAQKDQLRMGAMNARAGARDQKAKRKAFSDIFTILEINLPASTLTFLFRKHFFKVRGWFFGTLHVIA